VNKEQVIELSDGPEDCSNCSRTWSHWVREVRAGGKGTRKLFRRSPCSTRRLGRDFLQRRDQWKTGSIT